MKTTKILKLMGIVLIGLFLTTNLNANSRTNKSTGKKAITMTIDKPIIEFMVKAYADQLKADDIVRMQKILGQIDHVTVSFTDKTASDYILKFKPIDEQELEAWMFDAGYLSSDYQSEPVVAVPWMDSMHLD